MWLRIMSENGSACDYESWVKVGCEAPPFLNGSACDYESWVKVGCEGGANN
jgi:hypothetical protein